MGPDLSRLANPSEFAGDFLNNIPSPAPGGSHWDVVPSAPPDLVSVSLNKRNPDTIEGFIGGMQKKMVKVE